MKIQFCAFYQAGKKILFGGWCGGTLTITSSIVPRLWFSEFGLDNLVSEQWTMNASNLIVSKRRQYLNVVSIALLLMWSRLNILNFSGFTPRHRCHLPCEEDEVVYQDDLLWYKSGNLSIDKNCKRFKVSSHSK